MDGVERNLRGFLKISIFQRGRMAAVLAVAAAAAAVV